MEGKGIDSGRSGWLAAAFENAVVTDTRLMMENMSFDEQMEIGYTPLIISHIAWIYAEKAAKEGANNRVSELKPLSRALKVVRERYVDDLRKDLDLRHLQGVWDETERLHEYCSWDFTTLYYSVNNEIKRLHPELKYDVMRSYAYISIVCVRVLREHMKKMDKRIAERLNRRLSPTPIHPCMNGLEELMMAYLGDCSMDVDENVKTGVKIFEKNLKSIQFNLRT
jgi:hypothetical protein